MRCKWAAVILAMVLTPGCAMRQRTSFKASGPNTVVRPECLTAPLVLQDCNFSKEPPQCKLVTVRYRASCAEIQLKNPDDLAPK
jgi:hypothetical protein